MDVRRVKEVERDSYFMDVASAVGARANCLGTAVAAVLVMNDRIIGTGYNGTPSNFPNCRDGGCVRCRDVT
jgi:dCMP deaminase